MTRQTLLELHKENFGFSAGHFTIFSATEREAIHGHNYSVYVGLITQVTDSGISFDYRIYRDKVKKLCTELNQRMLLPTRSKYLQIEELPDYYHAHFNKQVIPFPKSDVVLLPLNNITLEELSQWFLNRLLDDNEQLKQHCIESIQIKVYNGPGQSGSAEAKIE